MFRERLLALRNQLATRGQALERNRRKPLNKDSGEQALELENAEVENALYEEAQAELQEIERALVRLEAGDYGTCEACDRKIAPERLEAYPAAVRCIDCAQA